MKKVLITGGLGFIGSHTCVALLENDYELVIVDNLSNSNKNVIEKIKLIVGESRKKRIKFFEGDIRNISFIENIFKQSIKNQAQISAVIHFAGLKSVAESVYYPLKYWETNVVNSTPMKCIDIFTFMRL